MKIGGMGDQALRVPLEMIRSIARLPADVRIVAVLPQYGSKGPTAWSPTAGPTPLFLHIRHRYCMRLRPGDVLCHQHIDDFMYTYADMRRQENERAGLPVDNDLNSVWVSDATPDEAP